MALPQSTDEVIYFNSKSREWGFLSNIFDSRIVQVYGGVAIACRCAESAYQAHKVNPDDPDYHVWTQKIAEATGLDARQLGRSLRSIREDWDDIRFQVMYEIVHAKFADGTDMRKRLLNTGTQQLVHYSPWDTFWGVDDKKRGHNQLGRILMSIRYDAQLDEDYKTRTKKSANLVKVARGGIQGYVDDPVLALAN